MLTVSGLMDVKVKYGANERLVNPKRKQSFKINGPGCDLSSGLFNHKHEGRDHRGWVPAVCRGDKTAGRSSRICLVVFL